MLKALPSKEEEKEKNNIMKLKNKMATNTYLLIIT